MSAYSRLLWLCLFIGLNGLNTSCRPHARKAPRAVPPQVEVQVLYQFVAEDSARSTCPLKGSTFIDSIFHKGQLESLISEYTSCMKADYNQIIASLAIRPGSEVFNITYYQHEENATCGSLEQFVSRRYWCPYKLHAVSRPAHLSIPYSYLSISRRFFDETGTINKRHIWSVIIERAEREIQDSLNTKNYCINAFRKVCTPMIFHAETAWNIIEKSQLTGFVIVRKIKIEMEFTGSGKIIDDGHLLISVICLYSKRRASSRAFHEPRTSYNDEARIIDRLGHALLEEVRFYSSPHD